MAIKRLFSILSCAFFLLIWAPIFAQTGAPSAGEVPADGTQPSPAEQEAEKNYYTREGPAGVVEVVQKITWPAAEYVRFYEVTLEKQVETGGWEHVGVYQTTANEMEVSLKSGDYRYRVTLYNLLGKKSFETAFEQFTVKKAYIPSLNEISPAVIYLDDIYDGNFTVRGANLLPLSVFTLEKATLKLKPQSVSVAQNERSASLIFLTESFDTGNWLLKVENPGGFFAEIPLEIRFIKWYDFTLSAGYKPLIMLHDDTIKKYFGTNASFLGAEFKTVFIPYKRRFGYFGAGLNFTYHRLGNTLDGYSLGTNLFQAYALFVYRLPIIKNRFILDARVGPGILAVQGLSFSFPHDLQSPPFTSIYFSAAAGISFQVFVYKRLYIEAGADFSAAIMPDMAFITAMPTISVGWQF